MSNQKEIIIKIPKLHQGQLEAKENFRRFNVLSIGRRFGKTTFALYELCTRAISGQKCAYIAPNYSMTTKFFKSICTKLLPIVKSVNQKDHIIELITGGTISTYSMESINTIRGNNFHYVVLDEAAFMTNLLTEWQNAIRPTLIDFEGEALFISSPNGFNDFYDLFEKSVTDQEWNSVQMPSHKNPYIPVNELKLVKDSLPSDAYDREILAQFNDVSSTIFKREWLQYVDVEDLPTDLVISMGVDLAISQKSTADYTAISVMGYSEDVNKFYILAIHHSRMSFLKIIDKIILMADMYKPSIIPIESVAFQSVVSNTLLENTNLPVVSIRPVMDKVSRSLPLATRFEKGDFYILNSLAIDQDFVKEFLAFPNKNVHDDIIDSLELCFSSLITAKPFVFSI
jgi:predicted phage terminase large subunit-like protein